MRVGWRLAAPRVTWLLGSRDDARYDKQKASAKCERKRKKIKKKETRKKTPITEYEVRAPLDEPVRNADPLPRDSSKPKGHRPPAPQSTTAGIELMNADDQQHPPPSPRPVTSGSKPVRPCGWPDGELGGEGKGWRPRRETGPAPSTSTLWGQMGFQSIYGTAPKKLLCRLAAPAHAAGSDAMRTGGNRCLGREAARVKWRLRRPGETGCRDELSEGHLTAGTSSRWTQIGII